MAGFGQNVLTKVLSIALVAVIALGIFIPLGTENASALPTGWTGGVISNEFSHSAAAIDANGALHIIYYILPIGDSSELKEFNIYYINNMNGNWTSPMLIATAHSYSNTIGIWMEIEPGLGIHIVHEDQSDGHTFLRYSTNQTGTWTVETIEDDMTGVSFVLDEYGQPHFAYMEMTVQEDDYQRFDVIHSAKIDGSWTSEITDTIETWNSDYVRYLNMPGSTSITIDSYGFCHIAYDYKQMVFYGDWTDPDNYVVDEIDEWCYIDLVSQSYWGWGYSSNIDYFESAVGGSVDLVVDTNDILHLVYVRSYDLNDTAELFTGGGTIQYANSTDWTWISETIVPRDCIVFASPTLVVNATGTPFVSFSDVTGNWLDDPGEFQTTSMSIEVLVWTGDYWGVLGEFPNCLHYYPYIVVNPQGSQLSLIYMQLDNIINPTSVEFSYATTTIAIMKGLPSAPGDFYMSTFYDQALLTWSSPSDDGGSPITGYRIYRGLSEDSMELIAELDAYTFEYTDTGLTLETTFFYKVVAVNEIGEGVFTLVLSVTPTVPMIPTVPGVPLNLTAMAGVDNITITWSPPLSNGGSPITGYTIYRKAGSEPLTFWRDVPADPLSILDTVVVKGVEYRYAISATNALGSGTMSGNVSAVPYGTPSAPTELQLDRGDGIISVCWSPPEYLGPGSVTYVLFRNGEVVYSGAVTEFDDDVDEGIAYSYRVAAVNDVGRGSNSSEGSMMLSTEPNDDGALMLGLASLAVGGAVAVAFVMLRKRR